MYPVQSVSDLTGSYTVRLTGWSRERRVIVLRRRLKGALGLAQSDEDGTPQLSFTEIGEATEVYEYSVLVTSLEGRN